MTTKEKLQKIHNLNTVIKFEDYPEFKPDFTPIEMFWLGIFGGNYYQINNFKKYSNKFLAEINSNNNDLWFDFYKKLFNKSYNVETNLFQVKCGSSYEQWIDRGWIFEIDPNGWVEWYVNFYYGRRDKCDKEQIKRWKSFKARHSGMLLAKCTPKEIDKCLKTRQNLLQWAVDSTKLHL